MKLADRLPRTAPHVHAIDGSQITNAIQRALTAAGLDTSSGPLKSATDTISRALAAAGLMPSRSTPAVQEAQLEGTARRVGMGALEPSTQREDSRLRAPTAVDQETTGSFLSRTFTNEAGTRTYRLYVPATYVSTAEEPVPLIVMLHGCTQSPEDFAAGTRMNALAEEHGFLVVYPAQAANANGSRCWNWFRAEDQRRETGEPALIAGLVREIASTYRIDQRRIFVAGLSAGAAMAVILGATYPELFAAVGAHSGLPYGAAHDMPSAFGAMHGGSGSLAARSVRGNTVTRTATEVQPVPTIVFHGDADQTVIASNGERIVQDVITADPSGARLSAAVDRGAAGRTYTRTVYTGASNRPVVEHWVLHGLGHAWSGGSVTGTFTDSNGPDASAEMIRFFFAQHRGGTA